MPSPPQLWDLDASAAGDDDTAAEASALATAELARIGFADRLRGWCDRRVRIQLADGTCHGLVQAVYRDAVELAAADADYLIALAAVRGVEGPPAYPAMPPSGRQRGSGLAVARDWLGSGVSVALSGDDMRSGALVGVGADHLELAAPGAVLLLPWAGLAWIRRQP